MDRRKELALLRLSDEETDVLLAAVPDEARGECWWLVLPDGTPVPGDGGGGVALLSALRFTRPLGSSLSTLRLSPFVDGADKLLSRSRKQLGWFVPEGSAPRRFP
ncbi:MAG: hypothetical protein ABFS14_13170 [Gemmatimonadota bacterium]